MNADLIIHADTIVTMDPSERILTPGWLEIRDGIIVDLGEGTKATDPGTVELRGSVAMPGLVNAHTHLFQTIIRDTFDGIPYTEWARAIYHSGQAMASSDLATAASLGFAESLLAGVTTVLDHQFLHGDGTGADVVIEQASAAGQRFALARTAMDLDTLAPDDALEDIPTALEAIDGLLDRHSAAINTGMLRVLGGGNTPGTSASGPMIEAQARHAQARGIGVSMHVAESTPVIDAVRGITGSGHVVEWLEKLGALQAGTIAAHSVKVTAGEISLLASHGVAVSHNPISNMYLGDGIAPVAEMLDAGVTVGLGTDGASSNGTQDPWENLKAAVLLSRIRGDSRWLTPREGLRMATIGGARALGFGEIVGSLEVGKRADISMVDVGHAAHAVGTHDIYSHLVYCARAADVRTVLVDGRLVVENRRLTGIDLPRLLREAHDRGAAVFGRLRANS